MSDIFVDKRVWPTPENSQLSNEHSVPLKQLINYWQSLLKVMTPEEADSATVIGHGNAVITKKYRRSDIEIRDAQKATLLEGLQAAIGDGTITPDELQQVLQRAANA